MTNVRPSSTFLSVPRYTSAYVATENSNFEVQKRGRNQEPDPTQSHINFFKTDQTEREKALYQKKSLLKEFKQMYNSTIPTQVEDTESKTLLVSPKYRREEVKHLRNNLNKYVSLKEKAMFVNKRNRQLKFGYRDNIRDVIIRPHTSANNFFSSRKNEAKKGEARPKSISYRTKLNREKLGTSAQIEFFSQNPDFVAQHRKDPWIDIAIGWNRKKIPETRPNKNTFQNILGSQ